MSWRRAAFAGLSVVVAVALLAALAAHKGVGLRAIADVLARANPWRVAVLGALAAVLAFLSAERWRMIEGHAKGHVAPSRIRAFGLTAIGVGIGQILPVQLATALSRAIGARLLRPSPSPRPVVVTLYEQSFDLATALLLAVASAGYFVLGRRAPWIVLALPAVAVGYAAAGPTVGLLTRLGAAAGRRGRIASWVSELVGADLFNGRLARALLSLSVIRFAVTALMAGVTSWAAGLDVGLPELVVALPLVVLATAAPITPAGLGVNEWTFAATLAALGAPMTLAVKWALINRILVFAVSVLVGGIGAAMLAADAMRRPAPEAQNL